MTNKSDLASAAKDRFACASTSIRRTPMSSTHDPASLDQRCIDTLRFLSVDMVQKADSGHPGLPLGAAPMAYVLWQRFLKHNPANPLWTDRDRFVLSAGHGSALLYSLLHVTGYDLPLDEIKRFRQWGSKAPGHPERGHTAGVEITTGPLGQGFANAVGMAMAEAQLAARYNRPGHVVVDHRTWVIASDGDLMEGVASEAASVAGHLEVGKRNGLYDDSRVTLAAGTDITLTEDRAARFAAYGWHVQTVDDGNDVAAIEGALQRARGETARPSLVLVRTHIGYGSPEQDSFKAHGSPLGEEGVAATKRKLGWPEQPPFLLPDDAIAQFRSALDRGKREQDAWQQRFDAYAEAFPGEARELRTSLEAKLPDGWDADIPVFPADAKGMATREAGGKVLSAIAPKLPALTGGSADLDPSTYPAGKGLGAFDPRAPPGEDAPGSTGGGWSSTGRHPPFGGRRHGWDADIPVFPADAKGMATREAGGKVLSAIAPKLPALTGGSADLDPSTYTAVKGLGDFDPRATPGEDEQGSTGGGWSYTGRNLHFGVREHAMGAICNGMAAHGGVIPYDATFLVFSDYMRPPMRLAALMRLHVVHVFTHDSIALGEDGPTHQPVEQLAGMRSVPELLVIRPADANETAVAWRVALEAKDRPVAFALSRQKVPTLDRARYASADGLRKGAYVLLDADGEIGSAACRGRVCQYV